jgi:phosphohistidine phosphatase
MDALLVRHAIAGERDSTKWPDDRDRPITAEGAQRFRAVSRVLAALVPKVDGVWSSPLRRAWQTAEILEEEAGWPTPRELESLEPGGTPDQLVAFLQNRRAEKTIALVGHEPSLSAIASHLLTRDSDRVRFEMKKGGGMLLRFDEKVAAGNATLIWLLPPRVILAE